MSSFNAEEIFEMAIQIERNGALFYRKAKETFTDASLSELLDRLAGMEDQHEQIFEKLKESVFGKKAPQSYGE